MKCEEIGEPLVSPSEVARSWGVSQGFVYNEIKAGKLPALRFGRVLRLTPEAILGYCERQKVEQRG